MTTVQEVSNLLTEKYPYGLDVRATDRLTGEGIAKVVGEPIVRLHFANISSSDIEILVEEANYGKTVIPWSDDLDLSESGFEANSGGVHYEVVAVAPEG